jgi:hypothetical protein
MDFIAGMWRDKPGRPVPAGRDYGRSTSPDARMNLLLRFETASGPRTIVAPGISLAMASEIAQAMSEAGHFADFVDHLPSMSVKGHLERRNEKEARWNAQVIGLDWRKQAAAYRS